MTVTPEQAFEWLADNNPDNRPINKGHVCGLRSDLENGRWVLHHQGIAFDVDGKLQDGQHRLTAIFECGVAAEMVVWFNMPREAVAGMDQQSKRGVRDVLSLRDGERVSRRHVSIASVMRKGLRVRATGSVSEGADFYLRHAAAIEFAAGALAPRPRLGLATVAAVIGRAYYSQELAELELFGRLIIEGHCVSDRDATVRKLRDFLLVGKPRRGGGGFIKEVYAKTERALAAWLENRALGQLYATKKELYPLPEDTAG